MNMKNAVSLALMMMMAMMEIHAQAPSPKPSPPSIYEPGVATQTYKEEAETIVIPCKASGFPKPTYEWYFSKTSDDYGSRVITRQNSEGPKVSYDNTVGTLIIANLTDAAVGFYSCRATNIISGRKVTAISPKIEVGVARIATRWNKGILEPVNQEEYTFADLTCLNPPKYYGPATFKWYFTWTDGTRLQEIRLDERMFIDIKGSLYFTYVKSADEQANRKYACALASGLSRNIITGGSVELIVEPFKGNLDDVARPVSRYTSNSDAPEALTFERGKEAEIHCFFSGYDPSHPNKLPTITWKQHSPIETGGRFVLKNHNRTLVITAVEDNDESMVFSCTGSIGSHSVTEHLAVNVTSPPIWVKPLQTQTVVQGENATFYCEARSMKDENPPEKPKWFRNGDPQTTDPGKFVFSNGERQLTVVSVQKDEDIACFQCLVKNSIGESFDDGCLNIILPIEIATQPALEQTVWIGDVVNLTVLATSDPAYPVSHYWTFRNTTYQPPDVPPFVVLDADRGLAYINTSDLTEAQMGEIAGVYKHTFFNGFQQKTVEIEVELDFPPVVVAGFDYWIIGLILALLLIILILIICCCVICRRKMQEGEYPVDRKETAAGLNPEKEMKESSFPALSRASLIPRDDPFQPGRKPSNLDFDDDSLHDDESFGSADYGEDEPSAFNEDGSFIGVYKNKPKKSANNPAFAKDNRGYHHGSESNV